MGVFAHSSARGGDLLAARVHPGRTGGPGGKPYFDRGELAGEAAHCFRDLRRAVETAEFTLQALPDGTPARTRAFINMVSAAAALHAGHLDEAVNTARSAVALAGPLRSSRYQRYVRDFVRDAAALHPNDARVVDLVAFTSPVVDGGDN